MGAGYRSTGTGSGVFDLSSAEIDAFPAVPLIVIGRDPEHAIELALQNEVPLAEAKALEDVWQQLLQEQRQLSPHANYVLAHQSGHSIHLDRPDVIADAIHSCLYPTRK